jgi:hypothetical protein
MRRCAGCNVRVAQRMLGQHWRARWGHVGHPDSSTRSQLRTAQRACPADLQTADSGMLSNHIQYDCCAIALASPDGGVRDWWRTGGRMGPERPLDLPGTPPVVAGRTAARVAGGCARVCGG